MERKEGLKDIVENGIEFVKNIEEEIAKAFNEMNRIMKEGCDSSCSDRGDIRAIENYPSSSDRDDKRELESCYRGDKKVLENKRVI